jgi:methionine--tRNA ligase beta chain
LEGLNTSAGEQITYEEFKKLDMRVGKIIGVERVKRTERLYKILVDLGSGTVRQTISSLTDYYTPDQLLNKKIIFLANLRPAKFSGELSEGMLLAAEKDGRLALLTIDRDMEEGAIVT